MTIISIKKDKVNKKWKCFNERTGKFFCIPLMKEKKIIDYIRKIYKETYKHTYILLRVYEE